jgi:hypothetical protein
MHSLADRNNQAIFVDRWSQFHGHLEIRVETKRLKLKLTDPKLESPFDRFVSLL